MRLKELRLERGFSQIEVAHGIKTGQSNIGRWENEEVLPSSDFIIKLADFFEVTTDYLLGRSDELDNVTVQSSAPALPDDERELLRLFRQMNQKQKNRVIGFSEGLLGTSSQSKFMA